MGIFKQVFGKKRNEEKTETTSQAVTDDQRTAQNGASEGSAEIARTDNGYEKVDVNKPLENFRLNVLLQEMKENRTDTGMNMLFEEIATKAHFLSVIMLSQEPKENGDGTATFKKNTMMKFPMLTAGNGKAFYPVFTDHAELAKWAQMQEPKTLILTFDDYAPMVLQNEQVEGIVINPFSHNLVLDRRMVEHMKTHKDLVTQGVSHRTVTKETKVMLGEPKEYPPAMVDAMKAHLQNVPQVERAWLRLMMQDKQPSYLVVVEFEGDRASIFKGIADAARPHLHKMFLDMIPYQENFGKRAVENVVPFYEK